jgi:hypothetical protein
MPIFVFDPQDAVLLFCKVPTFTEVEGESKAAMRCPRIHAKLSKLTM